MSDQGQGPGGFSWGEALNAALPLVGLTAGLYARPGAGQNIASFASLMALQKERERAEKDREAEREAFRLYPEIIKGRPGTMEMPSLPQRTDPTNFVEQGAMTPGEYVQHPPPRTETYQRMPTMPEALESARAFPVKDEGARAHLVKLIAQSRLSAMPEVPKELEQQRKEAGLAEGLLTSGRVTDPTQAQAIARGMGADRRGLEAFLPHRQTSRERLNEAAAEREAAFRVRLDRGGFQTETPKGRTVAYDAAVKAGAAEQARGIAGGGGERRTLKMDEEAANFVGATLPQLQKDLDTIAATKGLDPDDVKGVQAVLNAVREDPSPHNRSEAVKAVAALPNIARLNRHFTDRMAAVTRRLDEVRDRAAKAIEAKNLPLAEKAVQFELGRLDRQIRNLGDREVFADPRTKLQLKFEQDRLQGERE